MFKINKKEITRKAQHLKMVIFDFDGVFTDNRVLVFQDGKEAVFCSRGDGHGIKLLKETGIKVLVISTEVNPVVTARCKKLHINCIQACENKIETLAKEIKKRNIKFNEVAYLGNDVNDLECLKKVGLPVCVKDAHPEIFRHCLYRTQLKGGFGAVREFCDLITAVKKVRSRKN